MKSRRLDADRNNVAVGNHPLKQSPLVLASLLFVASIAAGCHTARAHRSLDRLHPCPGSEGPTDALCGSVTVFENRHTAIGRQIHLRVVVLPSLASTPSEDPLFFLAGGPGRRNPELVAKCRLQNVGGGRDHIGIIHDGLGALGHPDIGRGGA